MLKTPSQLPFPAYMMNFPFTVDNRVCNNVLMESYRNNPYDYDLAYSQFYEVYKTIASEAVVYLLPSKGNFQDLPFVANCAAYLPSHDFIVIANFKSEPRRGEEWVAADFFRMMEYKTVRPLTFFEGEADLKWLQGNVYCGGYGIRTELETYKWLQKVFDIEIIECEMTDSELYHFDCMFLPLGKQKALAVTEAFRKEDLKKLEKYVDIIPVPEEHRYSAFTNSLVLNNKVLYSPGQPEFGPAFEELISKQGRRPVLVNLTEFEKSGAALSCDLFHFNFVGRE